MPPLMNRSKSGCTLHQLHCNTIIGINDHTVKIRIPWPKRRCGTRKNPDRRRLPGPNAGTRPAYHPGIMLFQHIILSATLDENDMSLVVFSRPPTLFPYQIKRFPIDLGIVRGENDYVTGPRIPAEHHTYTVGAHQLFLDRHPPSNTIPNRYASPALELSEADDTNCW